MCCKNSKKIELGIVLYETSTKEDHKRDVKSKSNQNVTEMSFVMK